ncbi:MAG: cobalt-precorrin 5A hydrolase [Methanomicrobiales archaeon]|jgi:cobalt-precorrin 5A hydrolase|nr:cobalt-precorrin 5A hydrolase [Methanomicrobiales archaeon]
MNTADSQSSIAVIALERFFEIGKLISESLEAVLILYHDDVFTFAHSRYDVLVAVMSSGIAIRKIAPLLTDKWYDPALVVVTPDMKYAIPVLGGHHGGNEIAERLGQLGIIPVISTATEIRGVPSVERVAQIYDAAIMNRDSTRAVNGAFLDNMKDVHGDISGFPSLIRVHPPAIALATPGVSVLITSSPYIMGIGCRRGTSKVEIEEAIEAGCKEAGIPISAITTYATTVQKLHETGLHEAIRDRGSLVFLDDKTINEQQPHIMSNSQAQRLGLCGVSEPACLALSTYGELVLEKQVYGRVTIAIAR